MALSELEVNYQQMLEAQRRTAEAENQQKEAIAAQVAAEKAFHTKMLAMKDCIRGQFGSDSNEVKIVGLTRKSERKRPSSKNEKEAIAKSQPA